MREKGLLPQAGAVVSPWEPHRPQVLMAFPELVLGQLHSRRAGRDHLLPAGLPALVFALFAHRPRGLCALCFRGHAAALLPARERAGWLALLRDSLTSQVPAEARRVRSLHRQEGTTAASLRWPTRARPAASGPLREFGASCSAGRGGHAEPAGGAGSASP